MKRNVPLEVFENLEKETHTNIDIDFLKTFYSNANPTHNDVSVSKRIKNKIQISLDTLGHVRIHWRRHGVESIENSSQVAETKRVHLDLLLRSVQRRDSKLKVKIQVYE
ncbi:unnamed protein product [Sphenostylis stenocarpa]|uniref:Uncharacterized protein n=1 Tax=Sphenostylis stenocarpa TaxID=92480 RepID=A0AA86SVF4_9FABA|nr:unnamed protein product [Sphenostylis stenocarpa]